MRYRGTMTLQRYWIVALVLLIGEAWGQDQRDPLRFVTLWAGTLPIILAAPHGGREAVPGIGVRRGVMSRNLALDVTATRRNWQSKSEPCWPPSWEAGPF